jgi:hypothetical protein
MGIHEENRAPLTRPQRQALFGLPLMLTVGLLLGAKALLGSYDWPGWTAIVLVTVVVVLLVGMFASRARSEPPDERDCAIMLRASRRAFAFLMLTMLVPFSLRLGFSESPPPWDAERLAVSLLFLSQAVYFGSILLLYRRGAED